MHQEEFSAETVREQLHRIVSSPGFARNERLSRFLRFVVERHLAGEDSTLKESVIAIEVFGRRPDYDPKLDAIVRTEAIRLRARLSKYYAGESAANELRIELPKGGYVPVLRQPETKREERKTHSPRLWAAVAFVTFAALVVVTLGRQWIQQD